MFKDYTLQTTPTKALFSFAVGAVVGSTISALQSSTYVPSYVESANTFQFLLSKFLLSFKFGLYFWTVSIFVFGAPAWILAHFTGYRNWGSALLVGFFIPFTIIFALKFAFINKARIDYWSVASDSASFAIPCIFVALTIWRIAYRRPAPNPC
ncbi:MAG TPA: hypothetical protein EYG79_07650 [Rhodobacteraceae bacterium]|nr:hypothetical protein [Paracoccaceae bacterium]